MATIELTTDNFEETLTSNDIVLVDFWAEWCGPCRMFGPIFEKVSDDNPTIAFGKVDTEAQQALAATFNIQSIPTLMIVRDQVVVFSQAGAMPEASLVDLIDQVKALDMAAIHAEIAASRAGNADA
jgi:thioredoxin 1